MRHHVQNGAQRPSDGHLVASTPPAHVAHLRDLADRTNDRPGPNVTGLGDYCDQVVAGAVEASRERQAEIAAAEGLTVDEFRSRMTMDDKDCPLHPVAAAWARPRVKR